MLLLRAGRLESAILLGEIPSVKEQIKTTKSAVVEFGLFWYDQSETYTKF